ncbi:MAG: hypothetical protein JW837_16960 [Sedimentisphaerales bacterium]|nr:hypothetical protein [Sedimentisphaerales bacterium]
MGLAYVYPKSYDPSLRSCQDPTYIVDGVVHYRVANIPGAVGRISGQALCDATLPYVRELASIGVDTFTSVDLGRAEALNIKDRKIVNDAASVVFPDLPDSVDDKCTTNSCLF